MDQSLANPLPDLSSVHSPLSERIEAGRVAVLSQVQYFRNHFGLAQSRWKTDGTRVTEVDENISLAIFASLSSSFPLDDFCSEESSETSETRTLSAEFAWVLDPVDGTNNYAVGVPECAISLGLLQKGVPVYGFIYDYGRDNLLQGGPLIGSYEGQTPIQATTGLVNEKLTFCMHFPIPTSDLDALREALEEWRIRCPGSAAMGLANVATGRLDGCLEFRAKPWDCAAGFAICEGAGAQFFFLREPAFPMTSFSTQMEACPFRVGSQLFHENVCKALGISSPGS
jgi:myo-inositol-1(or 4)-monophosphatase